MGILVEPSHINSTLESLTRKAAKRCRRHFREYTCAAALTSRGILASCPISGGRHLSAHLLSPVRNFGGFSPSNLNSTPRLRFFFPFRLREVPHFNPEAPESSTTVCVWRQARSSIACIHPPLAFKDLILPDLILTMLSKHPTIVQAIMIQSLLFFLVLATLYPSSLGTECFHARRALPIVSHCRDIIQAIEDLSRMPGENQLRAWGRDLPTTPDTMKIPKIYWIGGRGPVTCAVHVDVNPLDATAVESFTQRSVALSAGRVMDKCLVRQALIGLDYPLGAEHIYAMIVRTDAPLGLELPRGHDTQNVSLPNSTYVLQIATGDVAISSQGPSTNIGSASLVLDQ